MKRTQKKLSNQSNTVKVSFTGSNITKYSGLNAVARYMNRQNIVQTINSSFPTRCYSATIFGINQIMIAAFSGDGLVKSLLRLDKDINENSLSAALKNIGQVCKQTVNGVVVKKLSLAG